MKQLVYFKQSEVKERIKVEKVTDDNEQLKKSSSSPPKIKETDKTVIIKPTEKIAEETKPFTCAIWMWWKE